jgi:outer membrane protein assembly factor BamA
LRLRPVGSNKLMQHKRGSAETPGHPTRGPRHSRVGPLLTASLVILAPPLHAQTRDNDSAPAPVRAPEPEIPIPSSAELEERGAVIGDIIFLNQDIFDESDPRENNKIYRLANQLHIKTREATLRAQLLFKSGDPFSWRVLRETERNLRRLDYLFDAHIRPIRWDGTRVDVAVATRDVWSLQPGISYTRKGGAESSSFEIEEENLLGYGKSLAIARSKDEERTSLLVQWRDLNMWGSRWRDDLVYSSNDDGHIRSAFFQRPFFSLDTHWSAGFGGRDERRVDPRYDLGEVIDEFRHDIASVDVSGGLSNGLIDGWTRRVVAGYRYIREEFASEPGRLPPLELPPDRTLSYPWVGMHWIEDEFIETQNLNQIGRTEDLYYGTSYRLELGWSAETLGATSDAAIVTAAAGTAFRWDDDRHSLFLTTGASGRVASGDIANGLLNGNARYYWRWDPKRVLYASLDGTTTDDLDPEDQLLMGGDTDLRGYPYSYQAGTGRMQFTLEQRFYTDWFPFRLFHVGGAVFFDAGRTWGRGIGGAESLGWLKDAGLGLRLGNARSGFGSVIHLDVAFALDATEDIDEVQFIVETKRSF